MLKEKIISLREKNVCHLIMVRSYHKLLSVISEETHQVLTQKIKRDLVFLFCN